LTHGCRRVQSPLDISEHLGIIEKCLSYPFFCLRRVRVIEDVSDVFKLKGVRVIEVTNSSCQKFCLLKVKRQNNLTYKGATLPCELVELYVPVPQLFELWR